MGFFFTTPGFYPQPVHNVPTNMVGLHSFFYAVCKVCFLLYFLRRKKNCLFALHLPRLFFDPRLNFFSFFFFFNFMTKFIVFSRQSLMIAVNSFSLMCTIMLTIPQSLHVVYDITVDRPPGRFPSHHCRNRWSILCFNSEKQKTKTSAHPPPFSN